MGVDLGNFGRHTILTGAGWSRNWGGRLANEVWQSVMDNPGVQKNDRLRALMLEEPSFEVALGLTRRPPFDSRDHATLQQAVLSSFESMDRELARIHHEPNIYAVQRLLFLFAGPRSKGVDTGYIFTLNQDLFPERHLYNEHVSHAPGPCLPGVQPQAGQRLFTTGVGPYSPGYIMHPTSAPLEQMRLRGQTNVIKLHGSFNWRTSDARDLLVIGTEKTAQIEAFPLLNWYFEIFRRVLQAGAVRLMIVGYGFADEHLNSIIAEAIASHGLRVFVWDTGADLKDRILSSPHGAVIWGGLLSIASRSLAEVFPASQDDTEEWRRIRDGFFLP